MTGCSSPAIQFHAAASEQGLVKVGGPLATYEKGRLVDGTPIHLYLDGDGTPWLGHGRIAADPTSRDRLILDLIKTDPTPSVLIGRPCYYQASPDCDPALWTARRYSIEVIEQIARAVDQILTRYPGSDITLIGYSGGGTLAMLVAPRIQRVDTVVTIAANLDTRAWAAYHAYSPLTGSLNPADQPPLGAAIKQYHFVGEKDENVPTVLMRHVVEKQPNAELTIVGGFDHACCWPAYWAAKIIEIGKTTPFGDQPRN